MRWPRRRRSDPTPPKKVRLIRPDGSTVPVECAYQGFDHGTHCWVAVAPVGIDPGDRVRVSVDVLPPRSSITVCGYVDHG